ncbi:uncharacterized protein LOC107228192 [Neodiprion lecontei]|uniref:Uncharacterized protein LOC107228192 n=1 Tax=Neodiprion lecontei TaxID=441921 RepID=A0A6J0CCG1_NEOLC|nr:uncharacterized protein LOC107228192 [Neodiprion lecontei]
MASFRHFIAPMLVLIFIGSTTADELWVERSGGVLGGFTNLCAKEDPKNVSVSCHGVRIVRKVVQQFLEKSAAVPNLELSEGVQLIETSAPMLSRRARNMKNSGVVEEIVNFLEGRELRVKLPSLLPDNLETALKESLPNANQGRKKGDGFGGGKGGGGGVMMMALMMGKMMGALGLGALGLLAMKALMVSGLALMLSLIVAAKKLAGGHDDGGGHHVIYAQESHGHGHRRSLDDTDFGDLPYRGYSIDYAVKNS